MSAARRLSELDEIRGPGRIPGSGTYVDASRLIEAASLAVTNELIASFETDLHFQYQHEPPIFVVPPFSTISTHLSHSRPAYYIHHQVSISHLACCSTRFDALFRTSPVA